MRDSIDIGPAPCQEDCVQVGQENYERKARAECNRFIEAIRRKLGPEPEGAHLSVKSNPHDFGAYLSVVCSYDDENEAARQYAYRCESDGPKTWHDVEYVPGTDGRERPAATGPNVCDSCLTAAYDELGEMGGDTDLAMQRTVCLEMGADIADHLCDEIEEPDLGPCACACKQASKRSIRHAQKQATA